ncbi:MAG: hypothetical protein JO270_10495 [Acidobacteriaceae bacterium]|nr:hypothetical protein [Acidobacteriaceae bacterium]MBV8571314.1 hypothetical protein [Acidobacteriaceae bacterium]
MKKVITSSLLSLAAVPFLMAAPAAKKVQNQPATANQTQTETKATTKSHKAHVKKSKKTTATESSAPAAAQPKQ